MALSFYFDYIKHRLTAKTRHGTHSPFVYQLADEVIYDKSDKSVYHSIENQRKRLLANNTWITVRDLGAGSQFGNGKQKKVSNIAKNALKSPALAQLLYRLAQQCKPKEIIELGTCLGVTTAYLSQAVPQGRVITMEGCPATAAVAAQSFKDLALDNVELQVGNFDDLLPKAIELSTSLDLVYIDGNHTQEATLRYFYQCLAKVHENTLLIFDDIYWSQGMKAAWQEIKAHPQVSVTVDLFWIGLVYFRKGQAKQHFKLRI